jgi:hypothetical protein
MRPLPCILLLLLLGISHALTAGDWSTAQVIDWADKLKVQDDTKALLKKGFLDNNVDGIVLLHVTDSDLQEDIGIESGIQRKVVLAAISTLKDSNKGHKSLSFWHLQVF